MSRRLDVRPAKLRVGMPFRSLGRDFRSSEDKVPCLDRHVCTVLVLNALSHGIEVADL